MYKKTAQLSDLTYANLTQMSTQDSYDSLYRLKLSGQSDTSPILRWTGNSPIWGKITVPTTSTDDSPTHAELAYANPANKYDYSNPTYQHNIAHHPRERSTACSTIIYSSGISKIPVQNIPESIQLNIQGPANSPIFQILLCTAHLKWTKMQNRTSQ